MRKVFVILLIAALIASYLIVPKSVAATPRVIVVPNDFPTITQAIQNATDGDTIFVKQGNYTENIVINKTITLIGEYANKTIIHGDGKGNIITIKEDGVTVKGFTLQYGETENSPRTYWVRYLPKSFGTDDVSLLRAAMLANPGDFDASGYPKDHGYCVDAGRRLAGIFLWNVSKCEVSGNRINDCGNGVWLYNSPNNTVVGNEFVRNDYGIHIYASGNTNITGNTFSNGGAGIYFMPIYAGNDNNDIANPLNANTTIVKNNFIDNQQPVDRIFLTDNIENYWDNGKAGNFWGKNYRGADNNTDGIGDTPYQIKGDFYTGGYQRKGAWVVQIHGVDNYPLMEPFNTGSMFVVYTPPPSPTQQQTQNPASPTLIEYIAAIGGIVAIAALLICLRKHK